ncbi:MAG: hydrogenase maturation protease [Thermoanaerobaculia bacterium]
MENYPSYCLKKNLVLGCGNIFFGDDGFGPEFIKYLEESGLIPEDTIAINAGLSIREILFNIVLSDKKPERIVIIDAVDLGEEPGEIFEVDLDEIPKIKIDDFSMHQMPTSNLLKELKEKGNVEVRVLSIQVENIPEEISPGISEKLKNSYEKMYQKLVKILEE